MQSDTSTHTILFSRASLLCCCCIAFIATVIGLCGGNSLACFAVILSDGMIATGWLAGACAIGAVVLRSFKLECNPTLFLASAGGLGLGIFSLLGLALGLLGWLNRPIAIAFPALSILLFLVDLLRRHPGRIDRSRIETWLRHPAGSAWLWLIPVISLAIAAVSASIMPGVLWKPLDPHPYDVTSYHLLVPREWYEGGRIVPLAHNVFSYFPFNVEMQFLLLMHATGGPWAGMYACQFLCVGYAGTMVLAVCGSGEGKRSTFNIQRPTFRETEDRPTGDRVLDYRFAESWKFNVERWTFAFDSNLIAAAFASTLPWVVMLAGVAYVESALMLYTALSVAWALRAISHPDRLMSTLLLSGIMAGFATGVKITAVPMLLLALPVAVFVALYQQPNMRKRVVTGCGALLIAGSVAVSPWLIRNAIWSGNPLFPLAMNVLGKDHFTDQQVERFRLAHSPTPAERSFPGKLASLRDGVILHWQYGFLFLPVSVLAIAVRWRDPHTWLLLICGLFTLGTWIGFTHLLPRFLVMLIPICAIAIGRVRWGGAWPVAVVLGLTGAGIGWSRVVPELLKQSNPPPFNSEPRPALIGFDPAFMMSPELVNARDAGMQIGLIGDAQAFLYEIPMSHLHYRTVFDLQPGDPIDAWVGTQAKDNPNWFLVINPMEIDRLHRTYFDVPAVPPAWEAHEPESFYLRGAKINAE